jgi:hypothetical protein
MSHTTVHQKLDILFDMFDWVDGHADGIKASIAFDIIQTILQRSLCFLPSHELFNIVEYLFGGSISMVQKAYWTKDIQ